MKFKAIFFDLDGTLIETERIHYQAWKTLVKQLGGPELGGEEYGKFLGGSERTLAEALIAKYKLPITVRGFIDHNRKLTKGSRAKAPIREGAIDFIKQLKKHAKVGVVTGAPRILAEQALERMGIDFDAVVCGDEIQKPKPAPEIYLRAAELAGVKPKDCAVFEDCQPGIESAKAAGMFTIAIPNLYAKPESLKGADMVIRSFSEVSPETL